MKEFWNWIFKVHFFGRNIVAYRPQAADLCVVTSQPPPPALPCRTYSLSDLQDLTGSEGKEMLATADTGQACLWWFRQEGATTTWREAEVGWWWRERDRKQARRPFFHSVLSADNPCRLWVENRYRKAVKGPFRHDDGILPERSALLLTHEDEDGGGGDFSECWHKVVPI